MNPQTSQVDANKHFRTRAHAALVLMLLALPFVIWGARESIDGMRITPEKWAGKSHPQRRTFEQFRSEFEGNDAVIVSWPDCNIDDPRLLEFEKQLRAANSLPDQPAVVPFESIATGSGTIASLTARPLRLKQAEAIERITGFLVGPDGRTSCAAVVLTYEGNEARRESTSHLLTVAQAATGLSANELIVAGPPHDGVAIDDESLRGINLFGTLSTAVATLFCFYFIRSWRITGLIVGVACFGQGIVLSSIYFSGVTLDAILIVAPPLIFVLTVSAAVHFVNYVKAQSADFTNEEAVLRAWAEGWKPCCLATLTTAVGLCSLSVSGIAPIALFGCLSGTGLLLTVGLVMCLLPDALVKWPLPRRGNELAQHSGSLQRLSHWVPRYALTISGLFAFGVIAALAGVQELRTSVDPTALFAEETKIIQDYRWVEANIGASAPVEIVLRFAERSAMNIAEQVDFVRQTHNSLAEVEGIQAVMSAVTFLPEEAGASDSDSVIRKAIVNRRLNAARDELDELNYFHEDETQQSWRITGKVFATRGVQYETIMRRIREHLSAEFADFDAESHGISFQLSGMLPLIENVQVTILNDLSRSLMTAFGLIGLSILLVLRNAKLAVLVTLLNTFPVLLVFGLMGGLSIPIDIGTMMTAGVAMGIAVDDTVHFLCFYNNRLREKIPHTQAVKESVITCGAAMLQTTIICAAGMTVFAASSFVPTKQFGVIMASILVTALVSDLICLPALLVLQGKRSAVFAKSHAKGTLLLTDRNSLSTSSIEASR